jgi:glutamine synthetase
MTIAENRSGLEPAVPGDPHAQTAQAAQPAQVVAAAIERGLVREIEVMWVDHQGHPRGKRIDATRFLERASGEGFGFCTAGLAWDINGEVRSGLRHSDWSTGFPDFYAVPDLRSFRLLPWRDGAGHVIADLVDQRRDLVSAAPRTVLHRAIERLASLGYDAKVGVEIEFHLLDDQGAPLVTGTQAYSLEVLNQLDPVLGEILDGLRPFVELEGGHSEYGPGQCEVNLGYVDALEAADQGARFKYATRELARRRNAIATFMAKPFGDQAGNSMHLHLSLWRDDEPAFAPDGDAENALMRHALGGILRHLPGIVLYGAPTVNSYKRFELGSLAPTSVTWGGDNRTVAVRSLVSTSGATRLELRTGAADAQPHWAIASLLAAVVVGIEGGLDPGRRREGNLYGTGEPLPATLTDAAAAARADRTIAEILGEDSVHDYAELAELEWRAFIGSVGDWDRDRYLRRA